MAKADLTPERLRELLEYDPETGKFTWLRNRAFKALGGTHAGYLNSNGYLRITVDDVSYAAHRLAWLYVHGRWPDKTIDHINRNKQDNRIANLRDVTHSEQNYNSSRSKAWKAKLATEATEAAGATLL